MLHSVKPAVTVHLLRYIYTTSEINFQQTKAHHTQSRSQFHLYTDICKILLDVKLRNTHST